MERDDVIIIATVSAIYGLGDPIKYREQMVMLKRDSASPEHDPPAAREHPVLRNDVAFDRGTFRVRGDTVRSSRLRGAGRPCGALGR
jgi:excinuclease ABC subunit B